MILKLEIIQSTLKTHPHSDKLTCNEDKGVNHSPGIWNRMHFLPWECRACEATCLPGRAKAWAAQAPEWILSKTGWPSKLGWISTLFLCPGFSIGCKSQLKYYSWDVLFSGAKSFPSLHSSPGGGRLVLPAWFTTPISSLLSQELLKMMTRIFSSSYDLIIQSLQRSSIT